MLKSIIEKIEDFKNGVYIEVEVEETSKLLLKEFCEENNIPTNSDYHCTLIYSKKPFKGIIDIPKINITTKPINFIRFDNEEEGIYALTLELDSKELRELHNFYMEKYNFKYDYEKYIPHITLSYKAKDVNKKDLPLPDFEIKLDKINVEPLVENWADSKK